MINSSSCSAIRFKFENITAIEITALLLEYSLHQMNSSQYLDQNSERSGILWTLSYYSFNWDDFPQFASSGLTNTDGMKTQRFGTICAQYCQMIEVRENEKHLLWTMWPRNFKYVEYIFSGWVFKAYIHSHVERLACALIGIASLLASLGD